MFYLKINLKFSVTFSKEQYKIFNLTVVMINSDCLVKLFLNTDLVNK